MEITSQIDFSILENKINALIDCLKAEKEKNAKLVQEKQELMSRLEAVETSLLKGSKNLEELSQERALTKMVVEELVLNIEKNFVVEPKETE